MKNASKPKRTTFNIDFDKKMMLERCAIDISHKLGYPVKWTDLMNHLIDNYTKEAMQDIIHKRDEEKKI